MNVRPQVLFVVVVTIVTGTPAPSHRSVAVGVVKDHGVPHSITKFVLAARTGGCVAIRVIVCLHIAELVQPMCSQTITLMDTQPPVLAASTNFVIECGTP